MECILALGTNLGDRATHLRQALAALRGILHIDAISRVYESEPVGLREQPEFWNLVLRAHTELPPRQLLQALKDIERSLGRTGAPRNAPRIIDIDLLSYDQIVWHDHEMDIPHPRMQQRSFVLYPLAEVAPAFRHPESGKTVSQLTRELLDPTRAVPLADSVLETDE